MNYSFTSFNTKDSIEYLIYIIKCEHLIRQVICTLCVLHTKIT